MGGKGSSGPSPQEMMEMQRTLQREAFDMQQQASLQQEDRAARRREEERVAELEKAGKMAEEEQREGMIMAEAEGMTSGEGGFNLTNLDAPQIESPDYAPRTELE